MYRTNRAYRVLVQYLKAEKAEYHTYQLKEEKPLRIVIRNLHPSTPLSLIKEELEVRLYEVRQVTNVLHKINKNPLPLFFVDLEPTLKSNEIFKMSSLLHCKIKIEEPYKPKTISQCFNCQQYGHTRTYCGYQPRCVRCGADHQSTACPNPRDTPPKCAHCSQNHPANYKGCTIYKELQRRKKSSTPSNRLQNNFNIQTTNVQSSHPPVRTFPNHHSPQTQTYAQATSNTPDFVAPPPSTDTQPPDLSKILTNFLGEFKNVINPLISLLTKRFKVLAPPDPTYWPSSARKNPDILDIFVSNLPNTLFHSTKNLLDLNSDHSSILLTLNTSPSVKESNKLFNKFTDHVKFHELVNSKIKLNTKLKSPNDIDLAVLNLTNIIQTAAWSATNTIPAPPSAISLPEYIRNKIVEKRRARALYQRTRLPSHKLNYNQLANSLKKLLSEFKSNIWHNHLIKLTPSDGSLWRETKHILRYKSPNLSIKKSDGSLAASDIEKAELFKDHLANTFQPHADIIDVENMNQVETFINTPLPVSPCQVIYTQ
ncbi:hypothetical protein QTP88_012049 [Uroleucon formosanum]